MGHRTILIEVPFRGFRGKTGHGAWSKEQGTILFEVPFRGFRGKTEHGAWGIGQCNCDLSKQAQLL